MCQVLRLVAFFPLYLLKQPVTIFRNVLKGLDTVLLIR